MNIYVANVSFTASANELKELFEQYGEVSSVKIVVDKDTQRSRGYAYVEMPNEKQGKHAVDALCGSVFLGKQLFVNQAKAQPDTVRSQQHNLASSFIRA